MSHNVFVAGHKGMVGRAIVSQLSNTEKNIITASRNELDLTNQNDVLNFFKNNKISQIYLAAAHVGGIIANNTYPADFIYNNLMIQSNVIHSAHLCDIDKILFLGSSCIYPKFAAQPINENSLLTGALEQTNEPYAIAKIAGIKLCESYNRQFNRDYRSVMPTNLYGAYDNFHPQNSHVIPALIKRFHDAKLNKDPCVVIWGSGNVFREFLHVNDLASACNFVMSLSKDDYHSNVSQTISHINVGTGKDCSIRHVAELIADITNFNGELIFDTTKPDGTPRKLLNISLINKLGWKSETNLYDGLKDTYEWYKENISYIRS